MRIHRFDNAPRPLDWLPNREHAFMGVKHDNTQVVCRVVRQPDGTYAVADNLFPELKGWLPMPMGWRA